MSDSKLEIKPANKGMPTTRWSLVRAAGGDATQKTRAMEEFVSDYWPAAYAFIRMKGSSPPDAEDLTQGFLISLIHNDALAAVTEDKGRFRSWFLASLKHFLANDWRDKNRLKRGGGAQHFSIDRDLGESWLESSASEKDSPDAVFERRWAWAILERALERLKRSYARNGKEATVRVLAPILLGADADKSYADAAEDLGISHSNARVLAFRMKKQLRALIREEVAETVETPAEVEEELDHFFKIFGAGE